MKQTIPGPTVSESMGYAVASGGALPKILTTTCTLNEHKEWYNHTMLVCHDSIKFNTCNIYLCTAQLSSVQAPRQVTAHLQMLHQAHGETQLLSPWIAREKLTHPTAIPSHPTTDR